jgi:uncharacterized protein (DUF2252 family)
MKKSSLPPAQPDERHAQLNTLRHEKMAESAHAYVRGSTVKFYEWLENSDRISLPEGPPVWICGDCHLGNLGPVASVDGSLGIAIRDFDQTVVGNPTHDLIRLGLSLAMAARSSDLPGVTTAYILERMIEGYETAFTADDPRDIAQMPETVKIAMRRAAGRSWKHLADERIEGVDPTIPLGRRFWPLAPEEDRAIRDLFQQEGVRKLITMLRTRDDEDPIEVVDAAYWRKGCSSLGRLRYAVLVAIGDGRPVRHCLVDIKEAAAAAAPRDTKAKMSRDNAERVVEGARHLSPTLGERMVPLKLLDKSVFIRELLPQDLKLEIEHLTRGEAVGVAEYLSAIVGHAHARQMDDMDRQSWLTDLKRNRSKSLDAPSWLWSSVVDLVGTHEAAYLEHCRRHALGGTAGPRPD